MAEPTLPAATVRLGALLECLCTAVEEVGPVCYCGPYFGGDTPLDHCEECSGGKCGQAWVRLVQAYPSSSFPNPDADGNCAMPLAYEWEVGVARCAPSMDVDGSAPTRDENLATTVQQYEDMRAMRKAIQCCFGSDDVDYILGPYTPGVVLGGCNVATWQVFSR
jgi:hypothetical protein